MGRCRGLVADVDRRVHRLRLRGRAGVADAGPCRESRHAAPRGGGGAAYRRGPIAGRTRPDELRGGTGGARRHRRVRPSKLAPAFITAALVEDAAPGAYGYLAAVVAEPPKPGTDRRCPTERQRRKPIAPGATMPRTRHWTHPGRLDPGPAIRAVVVPAGATRRPSCG